MRRQLKAQASTSPCRCQGPHPSMPAGQAGPCRLSSGLPVPLQQAKAGTFCLLALAVAAPQEPGMAESQAA